MSPLESHVNKLLNYYEHDKVWRREVAALPEEVVDLCRRMLKRKTSTLAKKKRIIELLVRIDDDRVSGMLEKLTTASEPILRAKAARAIEKRGNDSPGIRNCLIKGLEDESSVVREKSAQALCTLAPEIAREHLEKLASSDPHKHTRTKVSRMLTSM